MTAQTGVALLSMCVYVCMCMSVCGVTRTHIVFNCQACSTCRAGHAVIESATDCIALQPD